VLFIGSSSLCHLQASRLATVQNERNGREISLAYKLRDGDCGHISMCHPGISIETRRSPVSGNGVRTSSWESGRFDHEFRRPMIQAPRMIAAAKVGSSDWTKSGHFMASTRRWKRTLRQR
jgi:hypothetical protein